MQNGVHGIHHVTAIVGDAQRNVDFYARRLGLRLVKKTVNFDDPNTYHLYFGDGQGSPGTIFTTFPWGKAAHRGRHGTGQLAATGFAIPTSSLAYWIDRLQSAQVQIEKPARRFDASVLRFVDPDGLKLELVTVDDDPRAGWDNGEVPAEYAIRGFHHVTLALRKPEATAGLLRDALGFREDGEEGDRLRFVAATGEAGLRVELLAAPKAPPGSMGAGIVHHVAWRARDDAHQNALRELLLEKGLQVTPVRDRNYFHSIYFFEPGGVLFEIATDPPGFAIDEEPAHLGESLRLPPWLEEDRQRIEKALPSLDAP